MDFPSGDPVSAPSGRTSRFTPDDDADSGKNARPNDRMQVRSGMRKAEGFQ